MLTEVLEKEIKQTEEMLKNIHDEKDKYALKYHIERLKIMLYLGYPHKPVTFNIELPDRKENK